MINPKGHPLSLHRRGKLVLVHVWVLPTSLPTQSCLFAMRFCPIHCPWRLFIMTSEIICFSIVYLQETSQYTIEVIQSMPVFPSIRSLRTAPNQVWEDFSIYNKQRCSYLIFWVSHFHIFWPRRFKHCESNAKQIICSDKSIQHCTLRAIVGDTNEANAWNYQIQFHR